MAIELVDVAANYKGLLHQKDALNWLQKNIDSSVLESFAKKYRNEEENSQATWDWKGIAEVAKKAGAKFPDVVAAQWALESGWGAATSGKNNVFGLKGSGSKNETQEFINGKWIAIKDGFLDFPDVNTCVEYLITRWYKDYKNYKGVNRATSRNECAELLVKEGYATDPKYSTKLIQIMDRQLGTSGSAPAAQEPKTNKFNPWSPFTYKITPNITYGELTLNQEARRFTKQYQCDTAVELCLFLEKARTAFGNKPLIITSASRPEPINSQVGGARNSEHTYSIPSKGAIDFYVKDISVYQLQDWCDKHWPYSLGYGAPKGFVHVGIRESRQKIRWNY